MRGMSVLQAAQTLHGQKGTCHSPRLCPSQLIALPPTRLKNTALHSTPLLRQEIRTLCCCEINTLSIRFTSALLAPPRLGPRTLFLGTSVRGFQFGFLPLVCSLLPFPKVKLECAYDLRLSRALDKGTRSPPGSLRPALWCSPLLSWLPASAP